MSILLTKQLTKKQAEVLNFYEKFHENKKYSPALSEVADYFQRSVPTIHQHVDYLERKGYLVKQKGARYSIKILSNLKDISSTFILEEIKPTIKIIENKKLYKKENFKFNQFLCGDVLEMIKKIPDNSIHFAVTSPPYNVGKDYDNHNDKMSHQAYLEWLNKVWIETERVLVNGGRFAINIAPTGIRDFVPIHHDYIEQMKKIGMKFRTEILWYKQTMLKRTAWGSFKSPANPHIVPSWEYVLIFTKGENRLDGDQKMADITKEEFMKFSDGFWKIKPETQRKGHPAPFPEELIYRLVKFYSYKGNNILDMFGGTGTVAVIAKRTGRNFVHIDISPQYCKVAKDRVEKEEN